MTDKTPMTDAESLAWLNERLGIVETDANRVGLVLVSSYLVELETTRERQGAQLAALRTAARIYLEASEHDCDRCSYRPAVLQDPVSGHAWCEDCADRVEGERAEMIYFVGVARSALEKALSEHAAEG